MIVSGQLLLDKLHDNEATRYQAASLFLKDCLTVGRTLPDMAEEQKCQLPILERVDRSEGTAIMRFRSKDTYVQQVNPQSKDAWESLCSLSLMTENRHVFLLRRNEFVIADNGAMLHGRTPYKSGVHRRLWRLNFYNDGSLKSRLHLGVQYH